MHHKMKNVEASLTTKLSRIFGCIIEELSNHNFHSQFLMKTLCYLEACMSNEGITCFILHGAEWTKHFFISVENEQRLTKFCFAVSNRIDMFVRRVLMNFHIDGRRSELLLILFLLSTQQTMTFARYFDYVDEAKASLLKQLLHDNFLRRQNLRNVLTN